MHDLFQCEHVYSFAMVVKVTSNVKCIPIIHSAPDTVEPFRKSKWQQVQRTVTVKSDNGGRTSIGYVGRTIEKVNAFEQKKRENTFLRRWLPFRLNAVTQLKWSHDYVIGHSALPNFTQVSNNS